MSMNLARQDIAWPARLLWSLVFNHACRASERQLVDSCWLEGGGDWRILLGSELRPRAPAKHAGAFDHVFSGENLAFSVVGAWRGLALASRSASVVGCYLSGERWDIGFSHSHPAKRGYQVVTNRSACLFQPNAARCSGGSQSAPGAAHSIKAQRSCCWRSGIMRYAILRRRMR